MQRKVIDYHSGARSRRGKALLVVAATSALHVALWLLLVLRPWRGPYDVLLWEPGLVLLPSPLLVCVQWIYVRREMMTHGLHGVTYVAMVLAAVNLFAMFGFALIPAKR